MDSLWIKTARRPRFEPLAKSINTEVLIIGGGMAGLLCAYMLKNAGVDCVLAEANQICRGITPNTTAKITLQHGLIYDRLITDFGREKARLYLQAQIEACRLYGRLCEFIDCDYRVKDAYVYSIDNRNKAEKEVAALNRLGVKAELCDYTPLPFPVAGAVRVKDQAQFHPLKFAFELAKGLPVYENTKVLNLLPDKAVTDRGDIGFKKAIVATHFPFLNKHGGYFVKLYQHRSYVIALEGAQDVEGMYLDADEKGLSFRNYKNLLLLGGGAHRTGKKGGGWREPTAFAQRYYPTAKVVGRWATQDCMSLDGVPYIGRYASSTPSLLVATGFNKWGMTSSMVAATVLADLAQEKSNKYAAVFSPQRSILHPQLAANVFHSLVGILTPTVPRCPHMGCALKYNAEEHSWDCPCHGSRFEEDGTLMDNPATHGKNKPKV